MAQIQPFPCYEYGDGLQRPHVRKRDRARYVRPIRHDDRRAPLLRRAHRASVARPVASFRRIVPDCQPITTEGDACGLTFAARVSRDEDEFYSHAELQGVERSATEILRYYILAEWYLSIRANDLWTAYTQNSPQPSPRCRPTCSGFTVPYYDAPIGYLRAPKNIRSTEKYKSSTQAWFNKSISMQWN